MSKTRTLRLSETEDRLVEEFLKRNKFFDFSSLTRIALMSFIEKPDLTITPVRVDLRKEQPNERR